MLNSDYRDILSALSAAEAEYLVVGAYALASHGLVRATSDIDIWTNPTEANSNRVIAALREFGAPLEGLDAAAFTAEKQVIQIGVAPVRIDLLTSVDGLEFPSAWGNKETVSLDGLDVFVLSLSDLKTNKRTTARPQDLVDLRWIEDTEG